MGAQNLLLGTAIKHNAMKMRSALAAMTILLVISCHGNSESNQITNKPGGNSKEYPTMENIETQISALKKSMTDYMRSAHPNYTERDIDKCAQILNKYKNEMANSVSKEAGLQIVKATVLKLNELNESSGGELLETGERETIATIIITAGQNKGYNSIDEDITEEWREW